MNDFVFFDVETPNRRNDRICSIGVKITSNTGKELYSREFLVNPETGFDERSMAIHHIAPMDVKDKPSFDKVWNNELASVFSGANVIAHNAQFDLSVLEKTLESHGLQKPDFSYGCTYRLARRNIPGLPDYRLPTVSNHFGIQLDNHHDALSDAAACKEIYWSMLNQWGGEACRCLPYVWSDLIQKERLTDNCSQAMVDLYGIALGVSMDGVINDKELLGFSEWLSRYSSFRETRFFSQTVPLLESFLANGTMTRKEIGAIINLTRPFSMNEHHAFETVAMQELIGILRGIKADHIITQREALMLEDWLIDHEELQADKTFSTIDRHIHEVLQDGRIDPEEEAFLLDVFEKVANPVCGNKEGASDVVFSGQRFVLSGNFSAGPKSAVEAFIEARGGEIARSVSGKVSYVVVGEQECEQFAFGNYGTKVKKAMELQSAGKPIQIIQEAQLGIC